MSGHPRNRRSCFIVCAIIVGFTALVLMFNSGLFPVKPVAIATGSMEPDIQVGDVVIVGPVDVSKLEIGDIIQYQSDGYTVVHRIAGIVKDADGVSMFVTKGDHNNTEDKEPVYGTNIIGKVLFTIPKLGKNAVS